LENNLDVMNIILTRQRVENIVRILCTIFNYILINSLNIFFFVLSFLKNNFEYWSCIFLTILSSVA